MEKSLPIGAEFFDNVKENYFYIDKSALLKRLARKKEGTVLLFTRPRRFGKSLMLTTIKTFFEETGEDHSSLFQGTEVWKDSFARKEAFRYPVIHLNLKDCLGSTKEWMFGILRMVLAEEFLRQERNVRKDRLSKSQLSFFEKGISGKLSEEELPLSLEKLIGILNASSGKKPLVLIDEYDTPIRNAFKHGYGEEILSFFRSFYPRAFKEGIRFAALFGILQIDKKSLFPNVSIENDSLLEGENPESFGFTKEEVHSLLKAFRLGDQFDSVESWYGFYRIGGKSLFNPWSILNFIDNDAKYTDYWAQTGNVSILERSFGCLSNNGVPFLVSLSNGKERMVLSGDSFPMENDPEALKRLLFRTGYLTLGPDNHSLRIPNKELWFFFHHETLERLPCYSLPNALILLSCFKTRQVERIQEFLKSYLLSSDSSPRKTLSALRKDLSLLLKPDFSIHRLKDKRTNHFLLLVKDYQEGSYSSILAFRFLKGKVSWKALEASSLGSLKQCRKIIQNKSPILLFGIAFGNKKVKISTERIEN